MRAKMFDQSRVQYLMKNFSWKECKAGVAVLWDLEDGSVPKKYGKAFDFGVTSGQASKFNSLTDEEFKTMCETDRDQDFNGMKLFVIAGRHTSDALKGLFRSKFHASQ